MTYSKRVYNLAKRMCIAAIPDFKELSARDKRTAIDAWTPEAKIAVAEMAEAYRDGYTVMYCHSRITKKLSANWERNLQEDLKERGLIK